MVVIIVGEYVEGESIWGDERQSGPTSRNECHDETERATMLGMNAAEVKARRSQTCLMVFPFHDPRDQTQPLGYFYEGMGGTWPKLSSCSTRRRAICWTRKQGVLDISSTFTTSLYQGGSIPSRFQRFRATSMIALLRSSGAQQGCWVFHTHRNIFCSATWTLSR